GSAAAALREIDVDGLRALVDRATPADVAAALATPRRDLRHFAALLSPAAGERLEDLARAAHDLTVQRFGRTVHLFAPLYLSNECVSICTYCGFSAENESSRRTLSVDEVVDEAIALVDRGFRHVLLVAGEHATIVSTDHLVECVRALAPIVPQL